MTQSDFQYYKQFLPGITEELPEPFWKLAQLFSQNQFEWLADGRVVFLMNDAVESFLVFKDFTIVGTPDLEYEGIIEAKLSILEKGYLLLIRQGSENVVSIRFRQLELEAHLYNYGEIGHFWVAKQEDLRQLEYRLAILRDKICYLGKDYANEEECYLAQLVDFPPIMTWLAVPLKYATPKEKPWEVTLEAIEVMEHLAKEAGDERLCRELSLYKKHPTKFAGKNIAKLLTHFSHEKVLAHLALKIKNASSGYPDRSFGQELDEKHQKIWQEACAKIDGLKAAGVRATVLREEPFIESPDDITYKVYLMCIRKGLHKKIIEVVEIKEAEEKK